MDEVDMELGMDTARILQKVGPKSRKKKSLVSKAKKRKLGPEELIGNGKIDDYFHLVGINSLGRQIIT